MSCVLFKQGDFTGDLYGKLLSVCESKKPDNDCFWHNVVKIEPI